MADKKTQKKEVPKENRLQQNDDQDNAIGKLYKNAQKLLNVLVTIFLVGFLLNKSLLLFEKRTLQPLGNLVQVREFEANVWCVGEKNGQTIFYLTDSGATFLQSYALLKTLSSRTRVCTYDRAGRGFSSDHHVNASTGISVIEEFRNITKLSGEKGPFALVGHGLGALIAASYALKEPAQVHSVVLLDPMGTSINHTSLKNESIIYQSIKPYVHLGELLSITGLMRLVTLLEFTDIWGVNFRAPTTGHKVAVTDHLKYALNQPRAFAAARHEMEVVLPGLLDYLNSQKIEKSPKFPVLIIHADNFTTFPLVSNATNIAWSELQESEEILTQLAERTKIAVFPFGNHYFPYYFPVEVAQAISPLL